MKQTRGIVIIIPALLVIISGVLLLLSVFPGSKTRTLDEFETAAESTGEYIEPEISEDTPEPIEHEEPEAPIEPDITPNAGELGPGKGDEEIEEQIEERGTPLSVVLDASSIVVYDFDDLSDALKNNNGYTHIYLGDNIEMTGGIVVSSSKASFTIDGINPLEPGAGRHTLTEFSSAAITGAIQIDNASTKNAALKNLIIVGKNFFGTIYVAVAHDVEITYENISYTGPQIAYNRAGTCRFLDCDISVTTNHGSSSSVEELCEARNVVFGGRVTVTGTTAISMMWFAGTGGSTLTILDHADVNLNPQNSYLIFSAAPVNCVIGKSARLTVNSRHGMFYDTSLSLHLFGTLTIEEYGSLEINQSARSPLLTPTIKVRDGITVMPGGSLKVTALHASADPLITFTTSNTGAVFTDPDNVVLTNKTGKLFNWITGSGAIDITADTINYWTAAFTPQEAAGFAQMPTRYWWKRSGVLLNIRAVLSGTAMSGVTTTFEAGADSGAAPDTSTFNLITAHMLSFGRLPLFPDSPEADSGLFTGSAPPYAYIRLEHPTFGTKDGQADDGGLIYITVPLLDYPGVIDVTAQRGLLYKRDSVDVRPPMPEKTLELTHVPEHMPFGVKDISPTQQLYARDVPDWTIVITDTREIGAEWSLYVRAISPLTGEGGDAMPGALVYSDGTGEVYALDEIGVMAASGVRDEDEQTVRVNWTPLEGIMLQIPAVRQYEGAYTAAVEWTLVDGP